MKTAAPTSPASARRTRPARGPAPRPTSGRRSRSARRPPERPSAAVRLWTLGQGDEKPVAGCYGRLTRWKGEGCCLHGSAVVSGLRSGSGPDQSSPFLGPSTFLTTSLPFRQSIDNHRESLLERCVRTGFCRRRLSRPATAARAGACSTVPPRSPASLSPACSSSTAPQQ